MKALRRTIAAMALVTTSVSAQTPAHDPSDRLSEVLPASVAARVLAVIADARSHDLPGGSIALRALELNAKGAPPSEIEARVAAFAAGLGDGRRALALGGREHPAAGEIEAAEDVMTRGVDGTTVSSLARTAPPGRSLAVPLYVLSSLMDRGLPSDQAIARVHDALAAGVNDGAMDNGVSHAPTTGGKPAVTGRDLAATLQPIAPGRPSTVPGNGGQGMRPANPGSKGTGTGSHPGPVAPIAPPVHEVARP
jgi:hypothetical protein